MTTTCENDMITQHDFLNIAGTQSDAFDFEKVRLGIIGEGGINKMAKPENIIELRLETPFREPSNTLLIGNLVGIEVIFLTQHREKHTLNPS